MIDLAVKVVLALFVFFGVLNLAALHTWLERKQSAVIQDRVGANRASILGWRLMGLFHPLADSIKMFTKEDIVPAGADRILHTLAPVFSGYADVNGITLYHEIYGQYVPRPSFRGWTAPGRYTT